MKNKTHIYMANLLIKDIKANKITLPGVGTFKPPAEVRSAIINNQAAFRAGAVGPDFYPDFIIGQGTIHPDYSGRWLTLMFNRLRLSIPSERGKNLAFTLGYMVHYAGDMFGHTYVNSYAKGWFPPFTKILSNIEMPQIIIRHMLVESYMDRKVPEDTPMTLSPPLDFLRDVFTCDEAMDLMIRQEVDDTLQNPLGKFIGLRKDVHGHTLKAGVGMIPGVTPYVQNWEDDVDTGIKTWLDTWSKTSNIFAEGEEKRFSRALDLLEDWFIRKFTSMIGLPDLIGEAISFISNLNILGPLKEFLKEIYKNILKALAKAALGKERYEEIEKAVEDLEEYFKDPKTWLDNKTVFDRKNVSGELDTDFGNYGEEENTCRQTFHAFYQCLNMCKLCLIGTDNLNTIVDRASGKVRYSGTTFVPAARMGYIHVKTSGDIWSGTDNNVYLGIRYDDRGTNKKYEVLCDKAFYNDFEMGRQTTYPFFLPENIELSTVTHITARMSGHTIAGDWKCDWIKIKDSAKRLLFQRDDDFELVTGESKSLAFEKKYSVASQPLRIDPRIMNFLWSLDGKGANEANPATKKQWELGPILGGEWSFPFYDEEILRKNVFRPLFELPADPEAEEEPIDDDIEEEGADYLVNVRHGSDHEVHKTSCVFLPTKEENRCFLGWYETLDDAMEAALWEVPGRSVDGCYWCCRERHTT